ncbi:hypothetical protein, partial [Paenibacillus larvae]
MNKEKLVEHCGIVYRVIDNADVKEGDIIIFNEIPQHNLTLGKPYIVQYTEHVWIHDDYDDQYDFKPDDGFMVVEELDPEDPVAINFMMLIREQKIKLLRHEIEQFWDGRGQVYPEFAELMLSNLKNEMVALYERLRMTDWLKEGSFVRTTIPIENMPAGSLVQVNRRSFERFLWRCDSLKGEYEDIIIDIEDGYLESVDDPDTLDENERRIIDEFRNKSALKFAENLNNQENPSLELEMNAWENEEVLRVVTSPIHPFRKANGGEYSEIDKNGMIRFLITAKEYVKNEELKKEIDAIISVVGELEYTLSYEKWRYTPSTWEYRRELKKEIDAIISVVGELEYTLSYEKW